MTGKTTKKELLINLGIVKDNLQLGFAALALFDMPETRTLLEDAQYTSKRHSMGEPAYFKYLSGALGCPPVSEVITNEFAKMCLRTYLSEVIEVVKSYCEQQDNALKELAKEDKDWKPTFVPLLFEQAWFKFGRLIRNALAHWGYFTFDLSADKKELAQGPIKWRGKEIRLDMVGEYATFDLFGFDDALAMSKEIQLFVENELA
jgi:hypothetical protein